MITLRPATLETVRPLRLRALREDPDAFGSTLAGEERRPDADWHFWVDDSLIAFVVVAEPASAARRLYERMGFEPTGATGELRPGSGIRTFDLRRG